MMQVVVLRPVQEQVQEAAVVQEVPAPMGMMQHQGMLHRL
jgi:hypothetical protein